MSMLQQVACCAAPPPAQPGCEEKQQPASAGTLLTWQIMGLSVPGLSGRHLPSCSSMGAPVGGGLVGSAARAQAVHQGAVFGQAKAL